MDNKRNWHFDGHVTVWTDATNPQLAAICEEHPTVHRHPVNIIGIFHSFPRIRQTRKNITTVGSFKCCGLRNACVQDDLARCPALWGCPSLKPYAFLAQNGRLSCFPAAADEAPKPRSSGTRPHGLTPGMSHAPAPSKKRDWGAASYCAWLEVVWWFGCWCFCMLLSCFVYFWVTWYDLVMMSCYLLKLLMLFF